MCAVHAQYNQNLSELYVTPRALLRAEASIFNADPTGWFAVDNVDPELLDLLRVETIFSYKDVKVRSFGDVLSSD